ncbi:hypothetical protein CHS0354_018756 [Potamilus streckersoni]|uniref:MD-2-related lipid-recognition domain-containing protein n=1 Tax=Potamilus streckersoni TaxID=2493646 RepID=A0AAE0T319_9BIVA|nr:hypothetical protein CHS0354_018756 [Potamilus streckersoni]
MLVLIVLFATSLALLAACDGFSYSECDDIRDPILHVNYANITPSEVLIPGGLTPTVQLKIYRRVTGNLQLDVSIKKRIFFDITIPCISNVGSCSYDFCHLLSYMKDANGRARCPQELQRSNFPCTCPFQSGTYTLRGGTFRIPEMSGIWRWLSKGTYKIQAKLIDALTNEVVGCYCMQVSITDGCNGIGCIFGKK